MAYRCAIANDGLTAINSIQTEQPDIVLLDINMGWMGGLQFIQTVRQKGYVFPIIIVSAATNFSITEAIKLGANGFITKPFRSETILNTIEDILDTNPVVNGGLDDLFK